MSSVHIYLFIGLFIGFIYYKTKKYLRKQNEPILNDFESKQLITPTNCENCVTTKIIDENSGLFVQVKSNDIIINIDDNFLEQNIKSTDSMNLTNSVDMDIDLSDSDSVDKQCFIDCYGKDLNYPQFNLHKGKIYSQYNLYTLTGRPSNTYNSINFAALNKNDGERLCYIPANDKFVEFDMQGYHPRIIGDMISFNFGDRNTYELLGELLGVSTQEAKELTFKQLYGGVWAEYRDQPFFKDIVTLTDGIWDDYQHGGQYATRNRIFIRDAEMTQSKLLNYIIQSHETSNNVAMLDNILNYLSDKKTKLVLYVYDSFLFDYSKEDGKQLLTDIKELIHYPINIKQGKSYHGLEKL